MTRIPRLGTVTLAGALTFGMIFGVGAPAYADSDISNPENGAVYERGETVVVKAHVHLGSRGRLLITRPGADPRVVRDGLGPAGWTYPVDIGRNGTYRARIEVWKLLSGWVAKGTRTFSVRIPPTRPDDVRASVSGRHITLRWKLGREPDLTGYDVVSSNGYAKRGSVGSLCGETFCETELTMPVGTEGKMVIGVQARRSSGTGGTLTSAMSPTSVSLGGGRRPIGTEDTGLGGSESGTVPRRPFRYPTPQPLTENSPFSLPNVTPYGGARAFEYPNPQPKVAAPMPPPQQSRAVATVSPAQWGKSVALALILLLVAGHLGMWSRRTRLAPVAGDEGRRSRGTAARAVAAASPGQQESAAGRTVGRTPHGSAETETGRQSTVTGAVTAPQRQSGRHGRREPRGEQRPYRGRRRRLG